MVSIIKYYPITLVATLFLSRFNAILCQRSFPHLRAVFEEYKSFSKKDIDDVIKSEFSGDIKNGLLTVGTFLSQILVLHSNCVDNILLSVSLGCGTAIDYFVHTLLPYSVQQLTQQEQIDMSV